MRTHGTLVKWNEDRGYGFVALGSGGQEVFVHISAFPRDGQRPQVGEVVSFELQEGADGKRKAARVQRPGGRPVSPSITRAARRDQPASRSNGLRTLLVAASLAAIAVLGYTRWVAPTATSGISLVASPIADAALESEVFQCDGRIHCSQMRSCEEARYFVKHCPGARMDGNNDGEPCEQQLCN